MGWHGMRRPPRAQSRQRFWRCPPPSRVRARAPANASEMDIVADAASSVMRHSLAAAEVAAEELTKRANSLATAQDPLAWLAGDGDAPEDTCAPGGSEYACSRCQSRTELTCTAWPPIVGYVIGDGIDHRKGQFIWLKRGAGLVAQVVFVSQREAPRGTTTADGVTPSSAPCRPEPRDCVLGVFTLDRRSGRCSQRQRGGGGRVAPRSGPRGRLACRRALGETSRRASAPRTEAQPTSASARAAAARPSIGFEARLPASQDYTAHRSYSEMSDTSVTIHDGQDHGLLGHVRRCEDLEPRHDQEYPGLGQQLE